MWIGCSGWLYRDWNGAFYPADLPVSRWLPYYASRFATVELNNTFYRLPERRTFTRWGAQSPPAFLFAVKASRYLTHLKRLIQPTEPVARLLSRAYGLGSHLGPVLYQLPATFRVDLERLNGLIAALGRVPRRTALINAAERLNAPRALRHVIEFRDASWYRTDVFDLIAASGLAVCLHDKLEGRNLSEPVGPFAYVRFHGPSGAYAGSYSEHDLAAWAERIAGWAERGMDVYAYFNNDPAAAAPRNAKRLEELIGRLVERPEARG